MTVSDWGDKSEKDRLLATFYYNRALVQLMGLTALLGSVIVLLNYCTLPAVYNLQHIKKLTKNIILFFLAVIVYVMVYNTVFIKTESQVLSETIGTMPHLVELTLLTTYLVACHFPAPKRKLPKTKRKRKETPQDLHQNRL